MIIITSAKLALEEQLYMRGPMQGKGGGTPAFDAISNRSHVDYNLGHEITATVNYLARKGLITHIIVEAKMSRYESNVVAQVRSSFVSIY